MLHFSEFLGLGLEVDWNGIEKFLPIPFIRPKDDAAPGQSRNLHQLQFAKAIDQYADGATTSAYLW